MGMKEKEEMGKKVKVFSQNPEASMKLTVEGKNAIPQALKIMQTFDKACREIREKEDDDGSR